MNSVLIKVTNSNAFFGGRGGFIINNKGMKMSVNVHGRYVVETDVNGERNDKFVEFK